MGRARRLPARLTSIVLGNRGGASIGSGRALYDARRRSYAVHYDRRDLGRLERKEVELSHFVVIAAGPMAVVQDLLHMSLKIRSSRRSRSSGHQSLLLLLGVGLILILAQPASALDLKRVYLAATALVREAAREARERAQHSAHRKIDPFGAVSLSNERSAMLSEKTTEPRLERGLSDPRLREADVSRFHPRNRE
jgi:hypothetical protein